MNPLVALAGVLVVAAALSTYALAFANAPAPDHDRNRAEPALTDALNTLRDGGVVVPGALAALDGKRPSMNVSVRTANRSWTSGPHPPRDATTTSRRVPIRIAPGDVRPGRVRVGVWG